jgi:hypothetical protein
LNIDIINTEINKKCFFCNSLDSILKLKIHDAPLVLGCTTQTVNMDKLISYNVFKCKFCGLVFTDIDLDSEAYSQIHSEAVGKIWHEHHESFSKFVNFKTNSGMRLEIGPSNNPILRKNTVFIDMFEKSPFDLFENENYLKGKFPNITLKKKFKTIVASHVFEHSTNPEQFLNKCKNILDDDGNIFLSIPNFEIWINEKYWNGITAEHQIYPTITQIKKICKKLNLHPIFEHFQNHSIFIKIIKGDFIDDNIPYDLDVVKWAESIKSSIYAVEKTLIEKQVEDLFIIGASHLSQYPIMMSNIIKNRTKFILDNSINKREKRLYGTSNMCKSFEIINKDLEPYIVLFNSPYRDEMSNQIKKINSNANIIYA